MVADDAAGREQILLVDVVLALVAREQEVELRLEGVAPRIVVKVA
jgi:hypothetical protein